MLISGYVYLVVQDLKLKIETTKLSSSKINQRESSFEQDTTVNKNLFKKYLLFSENSRYSGNYSSLISDRKIFDEGSQLFIPESFTLDALKVNNCERFRCLQNRREFTQIPAAVWKGLLGTEDFRFLDHQGIDPIAIARAIIVDIAAMKFVQGGSTLTQQLVKNLFLTNERKLKRKITEMIYALYIENILSKEEIITLYLNEVFWGTFQGIYLKGFHSATLAYFNKDPKFISEYEATILISLLKGPNFYDPSLGVKRLKGRTRAVFKRLGELGLVSRTGESAWSDKQWERWKKDYDKRSRGSEFYSYYLASKNSDLALESYEKLVLFESVEKVKTYLKPRLKGADIGIKIMIADLECKSFDCPQSFSFYSKLERDKRQAMESEFHQVGSLLKPIIYESFIELGKSYKDEVSTEPITLVLRSGEWTPKDYSKVKVDEIELKVALQKSKNIPLIRVANDIGFEKLEKNLITKIPRLKKPLGEYPAQLLGATELSMSEGMKIYSDFVQSKCLEINENKTDFEDSVLFYMSLATETTISNLVRPPLKEARVFGKTGTTNNGLDNWYYAFDGKRAYLFWFGVESERNKFDLRLSGAVSSFLIFQNFMNERGKLISEIICE